MTTFVLRWHSWGVCNRNLHYLVFYRKGLPVADLRLDTGETHGHFNMAAWKNHLLESDYLLDVSNSAHWIQNKQKNEISSRLMCIVTGIVAEPWIEAWWKLRPNGQIGLESGRKATGVTRSSSELDTAVMSSTRWVSHQALPPPWGLLCKSAQCFKVNLDPNISPHCLH